MDLRYDDAVASQRRRLVRLLAWGGGAAAVLFGLMPLLHLALSPALAVPLALVAHLIALRVYLVRDSLRLLSAPRRAFGRWLVRLSCLWLGSLGYGSTLVPLAGVVTGVATFAGLTAGVHAYTLWMLDRERRRQPLTAWERVVLGALVLLTLAAALALVTIGLLVGWTVGELLQWF